MRSYYSHLETLGNPKNNEVHRSSAIFPAFQDNDLHTRLLFLGYWQIKRGIYELNSQVIVRNQVGEEIARQKLLIAQPKAYQVELSDLIGATPFEGSIEIEFTAERNLVFPFPAVSVNYYGSSFSSTVHTAQRIYNNQEDDLKNSDMHVPESGFTLYSTENLHPFLTLINGPVLTLEQTLQFNFYNSLQENLAYSTICKSLKPYELMIIHLDEIANLSSFLNGLSGTCKIDFQLQGVFPRLLAGNDVVSPTAKVVTHTYYDCSRAIDPKNYWSETNPEWHAASLMIPILGENRTTSIDLFPIFTPSPFALDLEIYSENGTLIRSIPDLYRINNGFNQYVSLSIGDFVKDGLPYGARIIARPLSEIPIPSRIKIALNLGVKNKGCPTNICTNLQPYVPSFSEKPSTFKWAPLLADQANASLFIMHSSPHKNGPNPAEILVTFYRLKDVETLERSYPLNSNALIWIRLIEDQELQQFFNGAVGWATIRTPNPYTSLYYLAENESGVVGGDHGY